jgi:hypothetical protein
MKFQNFFTFFDFYGLWRGRAVQPTTETRRALPERSELQYTLLL